MMSVAPAPATEFTTGTASEHVCRLVPVASPGATARSVRQSLEGVHFESATHIGVCADGKLVGVLRVATPETGTTLGRVDLGILE